MVVIIIIIFLQPEPRKKSKLPLTNSRIDPNVQGVPLDYSFRKADTLEELKNDTPREYRVGVPKKTSSGKFISRYVPFIHLRNFIYNVSPPFPGFSSNRLIVVCSF